MVRAGDRYGLHRVLNPEGCLPQSALKLDNTPVIYDNEILIDVAILNITAAAFTRLEQQFHGNPEKIGSEILRIIAERGKFQDPDTGSGGMLVGTVEEIGPKLIGKMDLQVGDKIATLVSLSLTPLLIDRVLRVDVEKDQVYVEGKAILFESGLYSKIPADLPESLSVAIMDVAGAPAHTAKLVKAGDTVAVVGVGKAGLLCLHEAKKRAGVTGRVVAIEPDVRQAEVVRNLGLADCVVQGDATKPVEVLRKFQAATGGHLADLVINTVNVPNTELASILIAKEHGQVLFFSMSTSFAKVALGAEGIGKVITLLVGTGYTEGHAEITLQILRENQPLRHYFEVLYQPR
ncbi:L-erythro-3,5-diaminohexanoate dehydrogenase [Clostridiales bacterium PH28_bin88]|nr:L-erythro-3,5-diaminohexanoate dehydrogenase [Clostridiales bacterium PH28_bin88]